MDELTKNYAGRVIAVLSQKVVADDATYGELMARMKRIYSVVQPIVVAIPDVMGNRLKPTRQRPTDRHSKRPFLPRAAVRYAGNLGRRATCQGENSGQCLLQQCRPSPRCLPLPEATAASCRRELPQAARENRVWNAYRSSSTCLPKQAFSKLSLDESLGCILVSLTYPLGNRTISPRGSIPDVPDRFILGRLHQTVR